MTLFKTNNTTTVVDAVTAEEAQEIYTALKSGKNATDLFKEGTPFAKTAEVEAELKKLEAEVLSKMPTATTETALKASMSSDILDTDILVTDVRIYSDGNPDEEPTFDTWKASFNTEE